MQLAKHFEDHMKLAVRMRAGRPLRSGNVKPPPTVPPPTVPELRAQLAKLETSTKFIERSQIPGYADAKYAVDALLDAVIPEAQAHLWVPRNSDSNVGHNYYDNLRRFYDMPKCPLRTELLEVYQLCDVLGFEEKGYTRDREDGKTQDAFAEAEATATASTFQIAWIDESPPGHHEPIYRAHRLAFWFIAAAGIIFLLSLSVIYGIRIVEFPDTVATTRR